VQQVIKFDRSDQVNFQAIALAYHEIRDFDLALENAICHPN
jgi:hypothetical protein